MNKTAIPAAGEALPAATTVFLALTPALRTTLATTIENLIALLDTIDGDENLEGTADDEPTLGWTDRGPSAFRADAGDREHDDSDDEDGADAEPSMGWTATQASANLHSSTRAQWDECEHENEHGGDILDEVHDDEPAEPNLGWTEAQSERGALPTGAEPGYRVDGWPLNSLGFTGQGHEEARAMLYPARKSNVLTVSGDELTIVAPGVARVGKSWAG